MIVYADGLTDFAERDTISTNYQQGAHLRRQSKPNNAMLKRKPQKTYFTLATPQKFAITLHEEMVPQQGGRTSSSCLEHCMSSAYPCMTQTLGGCLPMPRMKVKAVYENMF